MSSSSGESGLCSTAEQIRHISTVRPSSLFSAEHLTKIKFQKKKKCKHAINVRMTLPVLTKILELEEIFLSDILITNTL